MDLFSSAVSRVEVFGKAGSCFPRTLRRHFSHTQPGGDGVTRTVPRWRFVEATVETKRFIRISSWLEMSHSTVLSLFPIGIEISERGSGRTFALNAPNVVWEPSPVSFLSADSSFFLDNQKQAPQQPAPPTAAPATPNAAMVQAPMPGESFVASGLGASEKEGVCVGVSVGDLDGTADGNSDGVADGDRAGENDG